MPPDSVDVTVVLNGHCEGILIHRTFRSVLRAIDFAVVNGIRCELVVVLDRPNGATSDYFARTDSSAYRIVEADYGDPALARNRGVAEATGTYVAFVDGDDLVSCNWLAEAFMFAEQRHRSGRRLALHPEVNVFFGADSNILTHVDQEAPEWRLGSLFAANYWTALVFARAEDLRAVPYRASDASSGFGFEDWDWNCLAIGAGMVHKVVPATWHFIRLKGDRSRNRVAQGQDLLIRPSPVFERLETEPVRAPCAAPEDADHGLARILASPDLLAEWRDLARIEPELFPTAERLRRYRFWQPSRQEIGDAFGQLLRQWGPAPTDVILCDLLAEGDAGLAALNYVRALVEAGSRVLVVAGELGDIRLSYGGTGSLRIVDYSKVASDLDPYWRVQLLARALIQRPGRTVHLIEWGLGYEAIAAYGRAISGVTRVFATIPHLGVSREGERTGPAVSYFDRIAPHLAGLLSDNHAVPEWFCNTYGYPRDKCRIVRPGLYPDRVWSVPARRRPAARPTVLCVGERGRQSRPSLLLQIVRRMPDWDFVVFRPKMSNLDETDEFRAMLLAEPNVAEAAPGEDLGEAMAKASVFLHTSLVDGLPSTLIAASASGVPIVAPDLAAIRELVDEETGYPVRDFFGPDEYVSRLREVLGEAGRTRKRVARVKRRIKKEYSWSGLVASLRAIEECA